MGDHPLSKWQRVADWFATSFLGLVMLMPIAALLAFSWVATHIEMHTIDSANKRLDHPQPGSIVDHLMPYVIHGLKALLAAAVVLLLLRAVPYLVVTWVLLRTVEPEDSHSAARRRLSQFLLIPKGFGLLFVSVLLGAIVGLSVTNAPEAQGLFKLTMTVLAYTFFSLMVFAAAFVALRTQHDLVRMGEPARLAVTHDFLQRWTEAFSQRNRRWRCLLPPRWVQRLALNFARKPSVTAELVTTMVVLSFVADRHVMQLLSPMF